jgi:hypothetical protein
MEKSPNFKTAWWLILLLISSIYLISRYNIIILGQVNIFDGIVLIVWFSLMLRPLYSELDIMGFKFKEEIKEDIRELKTEIINSIDFRPQFTYNVNPPTDTHIREINREYPNMLSNISSYYNLTSSQPQPITFTSTDNNTFLFKVRFEIEKEIIRLMRTEFAESRLQPMPRMINKLEELSILDENLAHLIVDIWRICTAGVHGNDVSETQIQFVRKSINDILPILRALPHTPRYE